MDLWSQILATIEEPGAQVQWLHVPSHIGVVGNDKADLLADMGRRKSPLLRGYVTTSQALMDQRNAEPRSNVDSEVEHPPLWTAEEAIGMHGTPLHTQSASLVPRNQHPSLSTPRVLMAGTPRLHADGPPPPK